VERDGRKEGAGKEGKRGEEKGEKGSVRKPR